MNSVCVFCGSRPGQSRQFIETARALGRTLAEKNQTLVYGGANVGLMGAVADAALERGGTVVGVIPRFLQEKEVAHPGLTELILCETMHERKMKMFELSQGFVALPGGFGTLEEVIEVLTWHQLGIHSYPVAFLNVNGFYNHLRRFFDEMEQALFLTPTSKRMALFCDSIPELFREMESYQAFDVKHGIPKKGTPSLT
ncbi:MAG: TIGR00730 family Rossman fold protein [Bdellovibrionales bacterium]